MKYALGITIALLLSIGSFIPLPSDDAFSIYVKTFLFIITFILLVLYSNFLSFRKSIILYLSTVTIIFLVSSLFTNDIFYALDKYISVSWWLIAIIGLTQIQINKYGLITFFKILVYCGLLILLVTFIYKLNYGFWDRQTRFFINGPITFGWLMGFYFFISLYNYTVTRKNIYFLSSLLFFIALLWTESKGPLISLIVSYIFFLVYSRKFIFKALAAVVSTIIIIYNSQLLLLLSSILENTRFEAIIRIISGSLDEKDAGSVDIRQRMLKESYLLLSDNLLTGIGLANYQFNTIYGFFYPHNIHIEVFLECGIFVGLIYISFITTNFLKAPLIIKALMLFFIISGMFSGDITYLRLLIYCIFLSILFKNEFKTQ